MISDSMKSAAGAVVLVAVLFVVEGRSGTVPGSAGGGGVAVSAAAPQVPAPPPPAAEADAPRRFWVYRDASSKTNNGHWTNFMPEEAGKMIKLDLASKTDPFAGETCVRVDVKWQAPFWSGVAVSSQPDYWGEKEKRPAFDLRGAKKLVFHGRAAGDGPVYIQVKCGITGDKPFGDSAAAPADSGYVKLTRAWQSFEVPLRGTDMSRTVTPFCFVSSRDYNAGDISFFLDDIYFEF